MFVMLEIRTQPADGFPQGLAPDIDLDAAERIALANGNQLLADYCADYRTLQGDDAPERPAMRESSVPLRWLDTALTDYDDDLTPEQLLRGKIHRATTQEQQIQDGTGFAMYVGVPAYNEAEEVPALVDSLRAQVVDAPVKLVVADNNSTDNTSEVVQARGGNVLVATKQGAGAARQVALDGTLGDTPVRPERTVFVETDADSIPRDGYLASVLQSFRQNRNMLVGVGPSEYTIPTESGEELHLVGGRAYGELLGTQSMRGYFETFGRQAQDYLLDSPYRYLVGPNTTFRGSLFTEHGLDYRTDGRWEVLDLGVRVQRAVPSSQAIRYVPGQHMDVSPRAILGESSVLTADRLNEIRALGYVGMFKKDGNGHNPFTTMKAVLADIDRETYGLDPNQKVVAVVPEDNLRTKVHDTLPAVHAATGQLIVGKVALLARV